MDGTADPGGHPDEGLIHAWLDEALDAAESERLAAHVRECPACQARVAEARGLIAGASRIVAALDDVPAGTRPGWAQSVVASGASAEAGAAADVVPDRQPQRSLWRWMRVTPARAALAATILVALGIALTQERLADDSARSMTAVLNPQRADAPALDSAGGAGAGFATAEKAPARDELLDSAVARNVTMSQGKRTIGAAPGQPLPQAPPAPSPAAPPELASAQVAEGRAAAQLRREITGAVASDRARVGGAVGATDADVGAVSAIARATARRPDAQAANGAMVARESADAVANTCLRLESSEPGATWGEQPFPLVIAVEPGPANGPRSASVLTTAGAPTSARATWSARAGDSVSIALRRIGYSGTILLGPGGGARSGVAMSGPASAQLEQVVVADAPQSQARARATAERADTRKAASAPAASAAPQRTGVPQPAADAGPPVRQLLVTAQPIACPTR
ncbi:MAG TPA: zf-HC2 domain-containing protein [Gemmatimonadaceae bacterium]|nr:zf-HC2 domain-containing protein [Gemmatimonadaceae bacterium]